MFTLYRRLSVYLRPYWLLFFGAVLANAAYSAVDAGMVKLLQPLIDDVFVAKDQGLVRLIPWVLPLAFLLRGVMSFISDYGMSWISRQVVMQLRQQLFAHFQRLPASFYDNTSSGQLLAKLSYNVDQVAKATTDVIVDVVRSGFLITFLLGVMLSTSWRLTLLFILVCPIMALLFRQASKRFRRISHRIQDSIANVTHIAEENIESYKVVRTFNGQDYEISQFNKATEKNRRLEMKMILTKAISQPLIQFVGGFGLAMTVFIATSDISPETLSAGAFATLMTAMVALLNPIKQLTSISNKLQQGMAGLESVFEVLNQAAELDAGDKQLSAAKGEICFDKVSFSYEGSDKLILDTINLDISAGQTIAFVGRSGAGKSSLMSLLLRFYDGYQGQISIDGVDIRELSLRALRGSFAYVSQHVTLFNDTVANNIAYGEFDAVKMAEIEQAAVAANAMDFIKELPQGLNTLVGENGVLLSGGQRQRLAIARALYKKAPLLILDEATSALDTESEFAIQTALEKLMADKTTLVIAHRLSTIEQADRIVVLDRGKICESGSHGELLSQEGHYAKLYRKQQEN